MSWGHSPALDVQQHVEDVSTVSEQHALNVLLVGVNDVRHLLRTIAQAYRHAAGRRLHFFVLESSVESLARHLLLIALTLEPADIFTPVQKAHTFLEIYGNTLVRPKTLEYIRHKANQLILMVTDPSYLKGRLPLLSLDQLKYKERDYLECTYKFWRSASQQDFDIINLWDTRLRTTLGVRYDSRQGLFDWDYHMKLNCSMERGTPVTSQEYIGWRETGVAYRWPELAECTDTNVTFATGTLSQHTYRMCEYSGDQLTGPYVGFGMECEDSDMLRKYNNQFAKTATEISERNVTRIMYEIAYRKPYEVEPDIENGGAVVMQDHPPSTPTRTDFNATSPASFAQRDDYSYLSIEDTSVTFLSPSTLDDERPSARFRNSFHVLVVGQKLLPKVLAPPLLGLATDQALLILEGRKFVVGPKRCELQEFNETLLETATDIGLEPIPVDAEYDPAHQELMRYIYKRSH
jgi:dynein assembly factor 3